MAEKGPASSNHNTDDLYHLLVQPHQSVYKFSKVTFLTFIHIPPLLT
jgi:hypothetical protein